MSQFHPWQHQSPIPRFQPLIIGVFFFFIITYTPRYVRAVQTGPEAQPASCTMVSGPSRALRGRIVFLTTNPLLLLGCGCFGFLNLPPSVSVYVSWGELYTSRYGKS